MNDIEIVKASYPRARLVVDDNRVKFFGIWTGDQYIAISYRSSEEAWRMAATIIYELMIRKLER